jgi:hypothetical protein
MMDRRGLLKLAGMLALFKSGTSVASKVDASNSGSAGSKELPC